MKTVSILRPAAWAGAITLVLGMQAALQRLIQFHQSADTPKQRSLAKSYREELQKLKEQSALQKKKSHPHEAWTRNKENGKPI